jgi:hypothetical protein
VKNNDRSSYGPGGADGGSQGALIHRDGAEAEEVLTGPAPGEAAGALESRIVAMRADAVTVYQLIDVLGRVRTVEDAVHATLAAVCGAFGWLYGIYWTVDHEEWQHGSQNLLLRRLQGLILPIAASPARWILAALPIRRQGRLQQLSKSHHVPRSSRTVQA